VENDFGSIKDATPGGIDAELPLSSEKLTEKKVAAAAQCVYSD
jgi:hypothetical protein